MTTIGWVLFALVMAFVADRAAVWAEARGWIYWRSAPKNGLSSAAAGPFIEAFQPSYQYVVQERECMRLEVRQAGRANLATQVQT